jgi:hypothetical protein
MVNMTTMFAQSLLIAIGVAKGVLWNGPNARNSRLPVLAAVAKTNNVGFVTPTPQTPDLAIRVNQLLSSDYL